jgi:pimeloyl-ACP methyl ester carboxylesterase
MPSVRVGDLDVAYEVQGSGDPFLLVHGTTTSRACWDLVHPGLSPHHTVLLPDFTGSGETPDGGPDPLELDHLVEQMLAVASDAGADRFHVAGWSLGGVVAAAVAAAAPERVRTLAIVNGWAKADQRMVFTFRLWERLIEEGGDLFARYAFADGLTAGAFEAFTAAGVEGLVPAIVTAPGSLRHLDLDRRIDIGPLLGSITAPALVVGGVEDRWVDVCHSRDLAERINGARLVELACGHLTLTEQAGPLTALLLDHATRG